MDAPSDHYLLRIYIGSSDKVNQQPLYEHLVFEAKKQGIAGATVIKGVLSYGASSVIHSYKFWENTDKVPVIVEIIDEKPQVDAFLATVMPLLESIRYGCLVTLDKTTVVLCKSGSKRNI